jgi:hypothetical protein
MKIMSVASGIIQLAKAGLENVVLILILFTIYYRDQVFPFPLKYRL